ncbi:PucR family transcriptional regulator [Actinokineospora iranica]|uniref:PucR C-terminal helix-turn-helix domain-containing protein n=1 Tax=Actinokineospora iranica TaxID=1271860 RepID=A0A1G6J684_9PSEU|nr:helix-turn-helix domain-containing protein [Actinokineospora iranica]SDC14364.1 PucR C-terminal helix-turn-helix domain-containing protein [Actinokineospora iranica]
MTAPNANAITFGGTSLHERLTVALPALTTAVIDRLVDRLPIYNRLPAEELDGDVRTIVEQTIRGFSELLRDGRLPGPSELTEVRESAAKRAEEGLPIEAVIAAYYCGTQCCLDIMEPAAGPEDMASVFAAHRLLFDYLALVSSVVAAGYLDERRSSFGDEHDARQSLLSALLDGQPADEVADWAGIKLPACYLVLGMTVGAHPDEDRQDVDRSVAARRKLRRLRSELNRLTREPALTALSIDGGLALVPYHVPPADLSAADWTWLDALVARLSRAAGADIVAAVAPTEPKEVAAAARLAGELREVADVFDKPPGVYRLSDLLLEYQLTRPSPARDQLAALLAPAAAKPELLLTLRTFLTTGLNRRQTATRLLVHPNTVDYRLRKIATLSGLDFTRQEDLLTVRAALSAFDATARR